MRGEWSADILLILIVSSVIAVILSLVNRGKKNAQQTDVDKKTASSEEKP